MLFSSVTFLYAFLPVVLVGYALLPRRARNPWLLLTSVVFYAFGEPRWVILLLLCALSGWCFGLLMERFRGGRGAKIALACGLILDLGLLAFFKYADFLAETVNALTGAAVPLPGIPLPLGISFFTFQAMSYLIDVYRGTARAERSLISFATFLCLFPQLVAGPIVRYETVDQEIVSRQERFDDFHAGLQRFLVGLAKKMLLANPLGKVATELFGMGGDALSPLLAWLGAVCFALQILYDFSGYSDMAIGMGRMFGFHFLENFRYPYLCDSITDFWRRWHISLSTWFRDYIYIPLGGNRKGKARQLVNLVAVWALTGLWHGASWNFVLWGLYFAALLILEKLVFGKVLERLPTVLRHLYALFFVLLGWVIFNCTSLDAIGAYLHAMFAGTPGSGDGAYLIWFLRQYGLELVCAVLAATPLLPKLVAPWKEKAWAQTAYTVWLLGLFGLSLLTLANSSFNPFIYFRF